jgi:uncharacterized membrane protein
MPKSRVESFSDCVIAFAITLLILDIHLEDAGANIDNAGMIQALLALAPRFSIYVISFLICTVACVSHHELIHDVDCVDSRLLWLNNLYLMWIAFLPFPTGLLGHHPDQLLSYKLQPKALVSIVASTEPATGSVHRHRSPASAFPPSTSPSAAPLPFCPASVR